jgi:hypothetical protein
VVLGLAWNAQIVDYFPQGIAGKVPLGGIGSEQQEVSANAKSCHNRRCTKHSETLTDPVVFGAMG